MTDRLAQALDGFIERAKFRRLKSGKVGRPNTDGTYSFTSDDNPGMTYVQLVGNGGDPRSVIEAFNAGVPRIANFPCKLDKDADGQWIAYADYAKGALYMGEMAELGQFVAPHTHALGSGLDDYVEGRRYRPGLVRLDTPVSMNVMVEGFSYLYAGAIKVFAPRLMDLTSAIPATANTWAWVVISYAPATATLTATTGDEYGLMVALNEDLLEDITLPANSVPLGAVRVKASDTTIPSEDRFASRPDLRMIINGGDVLAAGSLDQLSDVVITSAAEDDILRNGASNWENHNIAEQRFVGRITGGHVTGLTAAQSKTLLAIDHGADLTGLGDDDHTQYVLLAGRAGGQTVIGGTASGESLTLNSTADATKGSVLLAGSLLRLDEANQIAGLGGAAVSGSKLTIYTGADANDGLVLKANSAGQTGNLLEAQPSGSTTPYVTIGPPVLPGNSVDINWLNITGTLPSTITAFAVAAYLNITTAGSTSSGNVSQQGLRIVMNAGYTGNRFTAAMAFINNAAGTGVGVSALVTRGNHGVIGGARATTTGVNIGGSFDATGADENVGVQGTTYANKANAINIGVMGQARASGSSGMVGLGGYFTLNNAGDDTYALAAALAANNYTETLPIFLALDNDTKIWSIEDGAYMTWTATPTSDTAPNDDTTLKKLSLQKLAAPPANAAYIAFAQNPGTDVFYLVMEEG